MSERNFMRALPFFRVRLRYIKRFYRKSRKKEARTRGKRRGSSGPGVFGGYEMRGGGEGSYRAPDRSSGPYN
jgi:hypothetical protein